jgi:hypothetical protein
MRSKLQKFTTFTGTLLPHETDYLLSIEQFSDDQRRAILHRVDFNCKHIDQFTPYDESLDKRKYSHLKNWILDRLRAIDVDVQFEWMSEMERKIMTDTILPVEEKQLLKAIRSYQAPGFYLTKFFELAKDYRHYLLIRMRYSDHQSVTAFLDKYQALYDRSKEINERIHLATIDIVDQYASNDSESRQWEEWLTEVFYDETIDGMNRYLAMVRLIFIGFNYRTFDSLLEKFDYLDQLFRKGVYYSKRLLLNYYHNRLMLHSKYKEKEKAVYYGYLSVRAKNSDYLLYVNNLCAVLLRQGRYEEALSVLKAAYPDSKTTKNFHNKIGYVAFYIESLNKNQRFRSAENYAATFLQAYKKEIFEYRWHLFFAAYLEALLQQQKYRELLRIVRNNKLLLREQKYQSRANYLPTILWFNSVAEYKEGQLSEQDLADTLLNHIHTLDPESGKFSLVIELLQLLKPHIPKVLNLVQGQLKDEGALVFLV